MKGLIYCLKNIVCINRKCIKGKRNLRDSQTAGPGDSLGLSAAAWDLSADRFTCPSVFPQPEPRWQLCQALPHHCLLPFTSTVSVATVRGCTTLEGPRTSIKREKTGNEGYFAVGMEWSFHLFPPFEWKSSTKPELEKLRQMQPGFLVSARFPYVARTQFLRRQHLSSLAQNVYDLRVTVNVSDLKPEVSSKYI